MRQHAIPQNVLDVEFKLFTKFTLKEFAYLAAGVGSGGFFLYNVSVDTVPPIVGIPLFVILSALGAFFALIPVNDQPADKFIGNFFTAINKPTQRVWLNSELRNQRNKPIVQQTQDGESEVIGASKVEDDAKKKIFSEEPGDDILQQASTSTPTKQENEEITKIEVVTPIAKEEVEDITITDDNILKYQFNIKSIDKLPGNINLWITNEKEEPINDLQVFLKDNKGNILYANKTGPNGYFLVNKEYPKGIYNIEFEGIATNLPNIKFVRSNKTSKLPLKITLK